MFDKISKFFKHLKTKSNTLITTRTGAEFILLKNNFGVVSAELAAIQKVIGRSAKSIKGIVNSNVTVDGGNKNSPLKAHFTLELEQGFAVNDVSADLVSAVRNDLEKIFAIRDVEIYVRVTDLSKPVEKPKRRVR